MPNVTQAELLPVVVSDKAYAKLLEYNELMNMDGDAFVRIGVKKEGAHLKKIIGFDEKKFTDQIFQCKELKFVIDRRDLKHFENQKIDFKETSQQKGFIFKSTE